MGRKAGNPQTRLFSAVVAVLLITVGCNRAPQSSADPLPNNEWHDFQGTWIATGTRQSISLGSERQASIAQLSGSLVLSGTSRPNVGFLADAIVLNDTASGTIGRASWTDERGDHIYSELKGEATASGSRISGTFIGGTGRYTGATGSYQFAWRFVLDTDDGRLQGQSEGLTGQIRMGTPASGAGSTQ